MSEGKAKAAIEARADLTEKLVAIANILAAVAEAMSVAGNELAQAVEAEKAATSCYIAELERKISEQRQLS